MSATTVSSIANPVSAERKAVYDAMQPATREMADKILQKQILLSRGTVEQFWDIGSMVLTAEADKDTIYGPRAIEQLQAYVPMAAFGVQKLAELKLLAQTYARDELRALAQRTCSNGKSISLTQWIRLSSVAKPKDRQQLTERVFAEGLSLSELEDILRSGSVARRNPATNGGRPPAIPTSPVAVAQKFGRLCATVQNFHGYLDANLFTTIDKLDTADPTIVENTLNKLKETQQAVKETQASLAEDFKRFSTMIKDVETRLVTAKKEAAAEKPAVDDDATDVPPEPKKPAAKAPAKPSGGKAPAKASGKAPAKKPNGKGKKPVKV